MGSTAAQLVSLARPRGVAWVLVLPLLGYGLGHWDHAAVVRAPVALVGVLLGWLLLHVGTMWLNAALDRDAHEVLFGQPVPVPATTRRAGLTALACCSLPVFVVSTGAGLCALTASLLSLAYSHPALAWKGHPLLGPAVNALGYGLLSPLAGWLVVGLPMTPRVASVLVLLVLWVLGAYFAAMAFQAREDGERGYRTLVVTHGPRAALQAARLCLGLAFGGFFALTLWGWFPRACLLALPAAWLVDRWLVLWMAQPGGGDATWARGLAMRLLLAGSLLVLFAYATYALDLFSGEMVAGWATARGHPAVLAP